eukprot:6175935-Pleurochrysis_carterae.AAC.11
MFQPRYSLAAAGARNWRPHMQWPIPEAALLKAELRPRRMHLRYRLSSLISHLILVLPQLVATLRQHWPAMQLRKALSRFMTVSQRECNFELFSARAKRINFKKDETRRRR